MSSTSRAWMVAAIISGVEAMKDQGFCGWNYTVRLIHKHAKNNHRSVSQSRKLSSPSSALISKQKAKQTEESMRKVIYLSSWGPY